MFQPVPYHHVSVATGSRYVNVAGQIARDEDANKLAPGDFAGQLAHTLRDTAKGPAGAGASFTDVVRLRFYATGWEPAVCAGFMAGLESVVEELSIPHVASAVMHWYGSLVRARCSRGGGSRSFTRLTRPTPDPRGAGRGPALSYSARRSTWSATWQYLGGCGQ
ncbi:MULTISPECIES: Rid family hydrolase [unclassified Brevibacterium]|uniref:Rid family hydrolase n=1 Tax=unclassified Brevibacterium TaxID=2614124 RepID=UPI001F10124D|nr:Rid family hydrolase [Brevibacterium sp. S22]